MNDADFSEFGECERCAREQMLRKSGICQICADQLEAIKRNPDERSRRMRALAQSENGIIRSTSRRMMLETNQAPRERKVRLSTILRTQEREDRISKAQEKKFQAAMDAGPIKLAATLPNDTLRVELAQISQELIRWIAKHPQEMYKLEPRKFEELMAEIMRDMGFQVEITKQTRDGGRDILASIKTPLGELLILVECKRWAPDRPIGVDVIRSFLHVIRENDKANVGVIATSATFTSEAKKDAREFEWLLKLRDWEHIRDWASNYGKWHNGLWLPTDML